MFVVSTHSIGQASIFNKLLIKQLYTKFTIFILYIGYIDNTISHIHVRQIIFIFLVNCTPPTLRPELAKLARTPRWRLWLPIGLRAELDLHPLEHGGRTVLPS